MRGRAAMMFVVAAWSVSLNGCYESLPLTQGVAPTTGRVELVLNDQGRAALSERLGTMVEKVEGTVLSQSADAYVIAVAKVSQLNGNSATWNGEEVSVRKDQTAGYQVRRLNAVKTVAIAVVVTAAIGYLFFGTKLLGGGTDDKPVPPDTGPPSRVIGK